MLAALELVSHGYLRALGAANREVETRHGRVHAYELRGSGEGRFVLLHGMGAAATAYVAVARRLRREARRVQLVDLPGHGRSEALPGRLDVETLSTALREALDSLIDEREPVVMLGTSLGGAAALGYALERPTRVRGLLLASPAGAPIGEHDLSELRARFALRSRSDARRFFSELLHAPPWYMRALEPGLMRQLGDARVQGFLENLEAGDVFPSAALAGLAPPTVVLWGKSDRILPRSGLTYFRRILPAGTRFEEPEGLGHSPHFEQPGLVVRELLRLWRDSAPTSRS